MVIRYFSYDFNNIIIKVHRMKLLIIDAVTLIKLI